MKAAVESTIDQILALAEVRSRAPAGRAHPETHSDPVSEGTFGSMVRWLIGDRARSGLEDYRIACGSKDPDRGVHYVVA